MTYKMWVIPFRGIKVRIVDTITGTIHSKHTTIKEARDCIMLLRTNEASG